MRPPVGRLECRPDSTLGQNSVDFVLNRRIVARPDLAIRGSMLPLAGPHFSTLRPLIRSLSRLSGRSDTRAIWNSRIHFRRLSRYSETPSPFVTR